MRWFAGFLLYAGVSLIIAFIICERFLPDELFLPDVSEQSATGRFGRFDRFDRRPVAPADRSDSSLSPKPYPPPPRARYRIDPDNDPRPDPSPRGTPPPPPTQLACSAYAAAAVARVSQLCTAGDCVKTWELWVLLVYALFLAWGGLTLAPFGVSTLVWLACVDVTTKERLGAKPPGVVRLAHGRSGLGGVGHEPERNGCCNGRERRGESGETERDKGDDSGEDGDADDEWCVYFFYFRMGNYTDAVFFLFTGSAPVFNPRTPMCSVGRSATAV